MNLNDPEVLEALGWLDEAEETRVEMQRRRKDIADAEFLAEKARQEDLKLHHDSYLAYKRAKKH